MESAQESLFHVSDLSPDARLAIEAIVGHPVRSGEMLYIATFRAGTQSGATERDAAWDELESMTSQMRQQAERSGLAPTQIDEIIDSECAAVRYGSGAANA
ncbi:MAG TPA: hypothetical protein VFW87_23235 [Pirellulales bacterium]|nr:hypothetical protein [Pirellulales bacterium]